jgi:phospholipid transport system substrate-binding protein
LLLYALAERRNPMMRSTPHWAGLLNHLFSLSVCILGYAFLSGAATAADSPLEVVRSTTDQALKVLTDSSGGGKTPSQQQLEKMWSLVLPRFDTQELAQRALGGNWQKLTDEQQREFTSLFIELVKMSYSDTLKRYSKDSQVSFDQERIEGDQAEVQTRISSPAQSAPFSVAYRLHLEGDGWLIYDVVAENVSLVQNYRNQFARIMAKSSGAGLLEALKQKVAELKAAQT